MTVGELGITYVDDQKQTMSPEELLAAASAFASVNALNVNYFQLTEVGDDFLMACREHGILTLYLDVMVVTSVSLRGIMDFCFEPTREGREHADRCIYELNFFDEVLFHRILEVRFCTKKCWCSRESPFSIKCNESTAAPLGGARAKFR